MNLNAFKMKLHIKITIIFAVLMVLISSFLVISSYNHLTRVINHVNKNAFDKILDDTTECLYDDFMKISSEMQLLSMTTLLQTSHEESCGDKIQLIKTVLDNNPSLNSVYLGYNNGDFLLIRRLLTIAGYEKYSPPGDSHYVVTSINKDVYGVGADLTFYDKDFVEGKRVFDESYVYDPRSRDWYNEAVDSGSIIVSSPYVFFSTKQIGITLAKNNADTDNVIGVDYTMDSLLNIVHQYSISPETRTLLINSKGQILTANYNDKIIYKTDGKYELVTVDNIIDPVINDYGKYSGENDEVSYYSGNELWRGKRKSFSLQADGEVYTVLTVTPERTLMTRASEYKNELIIAGIITILLVLPIVWFVSVIIAKPLRVLSDCLLRIKNFDFSDIPYMKSSVVEIENLIASSSNMINTIKNFQTIAETITKQKSYDVLLNTVLKETTAIINGVGGAVYLFDEDEEYLELCSVYINHLGDKEQNELLDKTASAGKISRQMFERYLDLDVQLCTEKDGISCFNKELLGWPEKAFESDVLLSAIYLKDSDGEMMGYIVYAHDKVEQSEENAESIASEKAFILALSGFVSAAIEGQLLLMKRKELMESLIVLIADAIDAKSAYTGKHCHRVPILTKMIVEEAAQSTEELYKDFHPVAAEWEEIRIASWLHDCGKVITPVDIVDKATKLECIYNRIHEVRMRFELLKSYADRDYWKGMHEGGNQQELEEENIRVKNELDAEFAFVAECNLGGEFMSDEAIDKLERIAGRVWVRTIDNTLGLADAERNLYIDETDTELPTEEKLLDNKPYHNIQRERKEYEKDNPWGFTMEEPELAFNRGEVYSLSVKRGTLTDEERYVINAHMIHTIKMLTSLPFPKNMKNIVQIAGAHHEKMDGGGYPRSIKARELPIPARAMAIADIFEALTASDRPYKKFKTLKDSISIMKRMADDNHIDKDLFELFVRSGRIEEYGQKYLLKEQLYQFNRDEFLD